MLRLVFHPKVWRALLVLLVFVCAVPFAAIFNYKWFKAIFFRGWMRQEWRYIREG